MATLQEIEDVFEPLARKYATRPGNGRVFTVQLNLQSLLATHPAEFEQRARAILARYKAWQTSKGIWGRVNFYFECGDPIRRLVIVTPENKAPSTQYVVWVDASEVCWLDAGEESSLQRQAIIAVVERGAAQAALSADVLVVALASDTPPQVPVT